MRHLSHVYHRTRSAPVHTLGEPSNRNDSYVKHTGRAHAFPEALIRNVVETSIETAACRSVAGDLTTIDMHDLARDERR
jgi:hypothetical protein